MKLNNFSFWIHAITIALFTCQQVPKSAEIDSEIQIPSISFPKEPKPVAPIDTNFITPDFYRVNERFVSDVQSANLQSYDAMWFTNKNQSQILVIGVATDLFQMSAHHFYTKEVPRDLLETLELHTTLNKVASLDQKEKFINELITQSSLMPDDFFKTNKGMVLGDNRNKAIKLNGQPHSTITKDGIEKLTWDYKGDMELDPAKFNPDEILAKNSFGHHIQMYFRDQVLIGLVYLNGIP